LVEERQTIDSMNAPVRNLGLIAENIPADQTAIIDLSEFRPRLLTYGDFRMSVHAVARGLVSQGVERGDRIGVLSLNRAEYLIILFGAALAGAVAVPLNIKLPPDTVRELLRMDAVRLIFAEHQFTPLAPPGTPVIRFGAEYRAFLKFGAFDDLAAGGDDISMQLCTSGSTGLPKGAPHPRRTDLGR
jgi:long-chain acyl-CoA synthetase